MNYILLPIIALTLGSFNTVLVSRIPEGKSIGGRSKCPNCGFQIPWFQNIPVVSYLVLKGRCGNCHSKIPNYYLKLELVTLILPCLVIGSFDRILPQLAVLIFTSLSTALAIIDWRTFKLPDLITYPLFFTLMTLFVLDSHLAKNWNPLFDSLVVAIAYSFFYSLIFIVSKGGMGLGDVKYAASIGLVVGQFGYFVSYYAIILSFFFGASYGIFLMIKGHASRKTALPFGPFMFAGTYLVLLFNSFI